MNEDVKQSAWFPAVDNLISGVCMVERESQTGDKDSVICHNTSKNYGTQYHWVERTLLKIL